MRTALTYIYSSQAPRVEHPGVFVNRAVSHETILREVLPKMDMMPCPTRSDMSSYAAAEAAACGLPVVISDVGGTSDLVKHGETGFLVKPWSAESFIEYVDFLLNDRDELEAMGLAARQYALNNLDSEITLGNLIDKTVRAYWQSAVRGVYAGQEAVARRNRGTAALPAATAPSKRRGRESWSPRAIWPPFEIVPR